MGEVPLYLSRGAAASPEALLSIPRRARQPPSPGLISGGDEPQSVHLKPADRSERTPTPTRWQTILKLTC